MRKLIGLALGGLLLLASSVPASARDFGTIYIDGQRYRTFGTPANVPAGTGTDPLVKFTNFAQDGVAQFGPGTGAQGGRWQIWLATWTDLGEARLITDFDDVLAEVRDGDLTLQRAPEMDFRCPIVPDRGANP
jgi:hypothetical protein